MPAETLAIIRQCADASATGTLRFPDLVQRLVAVGVERYLVDYIRGETTYYLGDDSTQTLLAAQIHDRPANDFDPSALQAAIAGAQAGRLDYPAFSRAALAAGCVGYIAALSGRRVVYFGRNGDCHVEPFPAAS